MQELQDKDFVIYPNIPCVGQTWFHQYTEQIVHIGNINSLKLNQTFIILSTQCNKFPF